MTTTGDEAARQEASAAVRAAAEAAHRAAGSLASAPEEAIGRALRAMADRLGRASDAIRTANDDDMRAADQAGLTGALKDRLRLDDTRLKGIADQLLFFELADDVAIIGGRIVVGFGDLRRHGAERRRPEIVRIGGIGDVR